MVKLWKNKCALKKQNQLVIETQWFLIFIETEATEINNLESSNYVQ